MTVFMTNRKVLRIRKGRKVIHSLLAPVETVKTACSSEFPEIQATHRLQINEIVKSMKKARENAKYH